MYIPTVNNYFNCQGTRYCYSITLDIRSECIPNLRKKVCNYVYSMTCAKFKCFVLSEGNWKVIH